MLEQVLPEKTQNYWEEIIPDLGESDWKEIHGRNYKCTIETQLRSFYFKVFHKTIALNEFLHKIGRKDTPLCEFCHKHSETIIHLFYECEKVKPIWDDLISLINIKLHTDFQIDKCWVMFGDPDDNLLTFLVLCCKFFIYRCRFQKITPHFNGLKSFILSKRNTEYNIANKRGKLNKHFKKWYFDMQ